MSPLQRDSGPAGRAGAAARSPEQPRTRCRSFCFLERSDERWTAFLMTYQKPEGGWRGYFAFRSATEPGEVSEIRTADLFLEDSEQAVDQRARGLGRPLLHALLDSALATQERRRGFSPQLQQWFRELLASSASERQRSMPTAATVPTLEELHTLYDSYCLDQVAHLIALLEPENFREMVEILLDGRRIDFRERDRFQLAMSVVQDLERRLPLPPFELWAEDYLAHEDEYRAYAHALRRGGDLP